MFQKKLATILAIIAFICCSSCVPKNSRKNDLPRPQHSYTHWLEKQSMLAQAPEFISEVSQSDLIWLNGSKGNRINLLLEKAPIWFETNAYAPFAKTPLLSRIQEHISMLSACGIKGLYIGPLGEELDIWLEEKGKSNFENDGKTAASLSLNASLGSEKDFEALSQKAEINSIELGSDMIPSATGQGPDFILQSRKAPGYSGLYAMIPVPKELWSLLPNPKSEWDCQKLNPAEIEKLSEQGLLPASLKRDSFNWTHTGGWAVTGIIQGIDGQQRRWIYRFARNVNEPLFLWQDPSGNTKKIFAAAIIQLTGLRRQALAGMHAREWMGLEPSDNSSEKSHDYAPGILALEEWVDQIHRYGGLAFQADPLPLDAIRTILNGNSDFCLDALTPAAIYASLVLRDVSPLVNLYGTLLKLDQKRLARGFNSWQKMDSRILRSFENGEDIYKKTKETIPQNNKDAINLLVSQFKKTPEQGNEFLTNWLMGLPGLVFINDNDLNINQNNTSDQILLQKLITMRTTLKLALGKITKIANNKKSTIGILSQLPNGDFWLLCGNFSEESQAFTIDLPKSVSKAYDASTEVDLSNNLKSGGQKFTLTLDVAQSKNVIFSKGSLD